MERRFIQSKQAAIRVDGEEGKAPTISGYGAVYYDGSADTEYVLWDDRWGRAVERIMPGAFNAALTRPDDVRGLFNHDPNIILGRTSAGTMTLTADMRGLQYTINAPDTQTARDVAASIKRGDVSGSSFSFTVSPEGERWTTTKDKDGRYNEIREILPNGVELFDTGPVVFPAYTGTSAAARSVGDVTELRKAREAARQQDGPSAEEIERRARVVEVEASL